MANGDDPLSGLNVRVVDERDDLSGRRNTNELLTFVNPVPDSPSEFRTGTTDRLKGLVQDLATARTDAAREREEARQEAAQRATAGLISTLGSKGLTQALTGVDVGAEERSKQAQQTLREAEEAQRQAEIEAETVEETADIEADIQAAEAERKAEQRSQELAQQGRRTNLEQLQNATSAINNAIGAARSFERKQSLMERRFQHEKEMAELRFRRELGMRGLEASGEEAEKLGEQVKAWRSYAGALSNVKLAVDQAYNWFEREEDRLASGAAQSQKLRGIDELLRPNLNRLEKARQALIENGVQVPESLDRQEERLMGIALSIQGSDVEADLGQFSDILSAHKKDYFGDDGVQNLDVQSITSKVVDNAIKTIEEEGGDSEEPLGNTAQFEEFDVR